MKKVIVEIDSDGVKIYRVEGFKKFLEFEKKIDFLSNYKPEGGLHFNDEEALIRVMERASVNYFNYKIEAVAGGVFAEMPRGYFNEINNEVIRRSRIPITVGLLDESTIDISKQVMETN